MKALTVLYHDVVLNGFDESGFPGDAAARYKFTVEEFAGHLAEIAARTAEPPVTVEAIKPSSSSIPFLLSFDDGGASAPAIADCIEEYGWRGHFFITTDFIGSRTFVTASQIRDLHCRGHVIGSHSCSHPLRFSELPPDVLSREWDRSTAALSDILGEEVSVASVPGGFYAPCVAESAAAAGIRNLFTSEPITRVETVAGCRIFGRFNIYRGMSARDAGAIAGGSSFALHRQRFTWEAKKKIKRFAWPLWQMARKLAFER